MFANVLGTARSLSDGNQVQGEPRGQINALNVTGPQTFAQKHRIAVPAQTQIIGRDLQHLKIALGFNRVARQCRWTLAKPQISFLQGHNVCIPGIYHIKDAPWVPPTIPASCFADNVADKAQCGLLVFILHSLYLGPKA